MIGKTYSVWSITSGLYVDSMHMNYPSVVLGLYKALSNQGSPWYKTKGLCCTTGGNSVYRFSEQHI